MLRVLFVITGMLLVAGAWAATLAPGMGLQGAFYATPDLTGPAVMRYAALDLSWKADTSPVAELKPGAFSAQWRGYLLPAFTETYTLTVTTAGGVRLMVNDKRMITEWTPHAEKASSADIALTAGKLTPIVLQFTHPAGAGRLKLQWASKRTPLAVIPALNLYPAIFSPSLLIYADNPNPAICALYMTEFDGVAKKVAVNGSAQPSISPDGKTIIFSTMPNLAYSSSGIYRVGINGLGLNQLTRAGGEKYDPAYSSDGQSILYIMKTALAWQVWTMGTNGTHRTMVIENAAEIRHPIFSPDGSYIVYQIKEKNLWNLYRVKLDGSENTALTTAGGCEAAISRRNDKIIFVSSRAGGAQLYEMKSDGTGQAPFIATAGLASRPFFDRTGLRLGYVEKDVKGNSNLFLVDIADRIPCQVTTSGKCLAAAITPIPVMPAGDNLALWLNAVQGSGMNLDEQNKVAGWTDNSLRGLVATQQNPGERPSYHPNGINGFPTVFFEGNSRLQVPDISAGWEGQGATLVLLFRPADWGQYTIVHQDNGGGGEHWRYGGNGDGYIGIFCPGRYDNYPPAMPTNGVHLLTIISGTQYTAYLDGVALPPRDVRFQMPTSLTIGVGGDGGYFKGDIAELAIYNRALTDDERKAVEEKFRALYGLDK